MVKRIIVCATFSVFSKRHHIIVFPLPSLLDLGSLSWDDLENDLPDELIPNGGDLSLMGGMPSNGGAAPGAGGPGGAPAGLGGGSGVPDAAAKHKQLSELLRAGSTSSITGTGLNSASPQPGSMGPQLGTPLGKSPLGQGSPNNHPSPQAQKAGTPTGVAGQNNNNNTAAMGLNTTGFNLNNSQGHAGLLAQGGQPQPGQVMNGALGPEAGRGRGAGVTGMQYQGPTMQGAAPGPGGANSALAETLTQGGQQMGAHTTLGAAQQAGNINKVSDDTRFLSSVGKLSLMRCESRWRRSVDTLMALIGWRQRIINLSAGLRLTGSWL